MKNLLILSAIIVLFCTGCASSFSPNDCGRATGISIYLGYSRLAKKNDPILKKAVEDIWVTIETIETYDDLAESVDEITKVFDICIANSGLTPEERQLCIVLKKEITDKVGQVLANSLERNKDATEFLLGVRSGLEFMVSACP